VRQKVDQRDGQLSLPHIGITKTESNRTKNIKTDEQRKLINGLVPWDQSDRQKLLHASSVCCQTFFGFKVYFGCLFRS